MFIFRGITPSSFVFSWENYSCLGINSFVSLFNPNFWQIAPEMLLSLCWRGLCRRSWGGQLWADIPIYQMNPSISQRLVMIKIRNWLQSSWLILMLCPDETQNLAPSIAEEKELHICGLALLYFSSVMHLNNLRSGQAIYI